MTPGGTIAAWATVLDVLHKSDRRDLQENNGARVLMPSGTKGWALFMIQRWQVFQKVVRMRGGEGYPERPSWTAVGFVYSSTIQQKCILMEH